VLLALVLASIVRPSIIVILFLLLLYILLLLPYLSFLNAVFRFTTVFNRLEYKSSIDYTQSIKIYSLIFKL